VKRVVLVVATDGIGRALAREYLERGWGVGVVGRDPGKLEGVVEGLTREVPGGTARGVVCDVADGARVGDAFAEILGELGHMDLLVYCAGVLPQAESLDERIEGAGRMVEVNVRGAIHWLELGADYFVSLGRGHLAAIGSVAGERGRKGAPAYGASKAALHQYAEGLRHRLHGTGVTVSVAKPGWVKTRMLPDEAAASPLSVSAERAARLVYRGLARGRESFYVPWWWGIPGLALKLLPRALFKRIAPP
jgi:short-subunit dehydrogenase